MNGKIWIRTWFLIILIVIPIAIINYVIDPMGYNGIYSNMFNKYKVRLDERKEKFNLLKENNYDTYIFGSSRCRVIDPDRINKHIKANGINSAFSSGTIDEIHRYIKWLVKNKEVKNIIIGIDLFGFSDNFSSNGIMPNELSEDKIKLNKYLSYSMFSYSLKTAVYNLKDKHKKQNPAYKEKGMYYVYDYFNLKNKEEFNEFIQNKVTNKPASWHAKDFSVKKIKILTDIISLAEQNNINLHFFVNPITHQQIFKDDNFLVHLDLIKNIIKQNPELKIIDFNNFNDINFNNDYFLDYFHYNYDVANCIIDEIYSDKSECGVNFGYTLDSDNIDNYIYEIKQKYNELKIIKN